MKVNTINNTEFRKYRIEAIEKRRKDRSVAYVYTDKQLISYFEDEFDAQLLIIDSINEMGIDLTNDCLKDFCEAQNDIEYIYKIEVLDEPFVKYRVKIGYVDSDYVETYFVDNTKDLEILLDHHGVDKQVLDQLPNLNIVNSLLKDLRYSISVDKVETTIDVVHNVQELDTLYNGKKIIVLDKDVNIDSLGNDTYKIVAALHKEESAKEHCREVTLVAGDNFSMKFDTIFDGLEWLVNSDAKAIKYSLEMFSNEELNDCDNLYYLEYFEDLNRYATRDYDEDDALPENLKYTLARFEDRFAAKYVFVWDYRYCHNNMDFDWRADEAPFLNCLSLEEVNKVLKQLPLNKEYRFEA